jgi:hypothetical protein
MVLPRFRLWHLMVLVAVAAVLAWIARYQDGRTGLYLAVLLAGSLAVGAGINWVIDWIADGIFHDDGGPDREG